MTTENTQENTQEENVEKKELTMADWQKMIIVKVAPDKLSAQLEISSACEEDKIDYNKLLEIINKSQVVYGIDEERLKKVAANLGVFKGESLSFAKGLAPTESVDGYIEILKDDTSKNRKPLILQDGRVDFFQLTDITTVMKGEEIARKTEPIHGEKGTNVFGNDVLPRTPKNPNFPIGKNVLVNQEGTALYSLLDGQVSITDNGKLNVFNLYEVKGDVDFSTGNIDFVGSVLVNGSILSGFSVKAKGDIRVKGNIEGAIVESDGSIEIRGGIIGYNKGKVSAKQNIQASFIQNANVMAGNDVVVSDSIMHSHVSAGNKVLLNGNKALLVGGITRASDEIFAKSIGNAMATPTEVQVGISPELRNEYIEITGKLKEYKENIVKTKQALEVLNQLKAINKIDHDKEEMRIKLLASLKSMAEYLVEGGNRLAVIEEIFAEAPSAKIKASNAVYPGVKIVIGNEHRVIIEETKRAVFYISEGEISFMPL